MKWNLPNYFLFAGNADRDCILRSLSHFRQDAKPILWLLALMVLSTLMGLFQAWPLAILIDTITSPHASPGWLHRLITGWLPATPLGTIGGLAFLALLLRIGQEGFGMGRKLLQGRINYNSIFRMRCELFRKLQGMHLGYHRSRPVGDSILRLTADTSGCHMVLGVAVNVIFALFTISVILAILLSRNAALTLIALQVIPALVWANTYFGRKFGQKTIEAKEADGAYISAVHRAVATIGLTQSFGREEDECRRFGSIAGQSARLWTGVHRQEVGYGLSVGTILGTGGAVILGYGGYLVQEGRLTPGELMLFMSYLAMLYDPLCQLTGAGMNLQSGLAGARRVFEVLDEDTLIAETPEALPLPVQPRSLRLEEVRFHYAAGAPVLDGVSVAVPPGASVGFVGPSGTGKSTLLSLLPRFYDPAGGSISLDGHDIRNVRLKDLRSHIALALQDSVIVPATVYENIAYGRPTATRSEIREAARLSGASDFIERLPRGYDTELADGGQNLSGGQWQRIAVARALLTEAPIVVLDEPTSVQDAHNEGVLVDTLRLLKGKRTVILVSHRIRTVRDCDTICVMEGGAIREMGTHDELLKRRGLYYRLAETGEDTGKRTIPLRDYPSLAPLGLAVSRRAHAHRTHVSRGS